MASKKGGKHIGGPTGSMQYTIGYKKRLKEKMEKEEEYWASLCGPGTVTYKTK
jgi:tRNA U34 2-thiouridine synthase MnmA/TrmU